MKRIDNDAFYNYIKQYDPDSIYQGVFFAGRRERLDTDPGYIMERVREDSSIDRGRVSDDGRRDMRTA